MFWILAGLMTALVTGVVVTPLYQHNRRLAMALVFIIPFFALGIYLWGGHPELTNAIRL